MKTNESKIEKKEKILSQFRDGLSETKVLNMIYVFIVVCCRRLVDLEKQRANRQDFTLIWLDTKVDKCDEHTRKLVRKLNDYAKVYADIIECYEYLNGMRDPAFLIISGTCAAQCLPRLHSLPAVDSIFIYCARPSKHRSLVGAYRKVVCCVSTERELLQQVHWWTELKCSTEVCTCGRELHRLTRDSALFLGYQIVLDGIFLESTKEDMVRVCRAYYAENLIEKAHIDEFEAMYTKDQAVTWYTRNAFVYKILKKILRRFDLDKLQAFGFYIRDLHEQLRRWRQPPFRAFFAYRGLTMSVVNIAQLQANVGNIVTPNGFLSTSRTREIAMDYARKRGIIELGGRFCNVLLEIEIGTDVAPSCIFADVAHVSAFPGEREILFSVGAIFRVNEVKLLPETSIYVVKMKAANAKEYSLVDNLLDMARSKFANHNNQQLLSKLLLYTRFDLQHRSNINKSTTWSDLRCGMQATSQPAMKTLIYGATKFTRTPYLYSITARPCDEKRAFDIDEPGFCLYSDVPSLRIRLITDIGEDKNWVTRCELDRILASSDFQRCPRTYFIISSTQFPLHLLTLGSKWLHIYSYNNDGDSDEFLDQLHHDLAQYYRQTAQRVLRERNDRQAAKNFLLQATRFYELLEQDTEAAIKRFGAMSPPSSRD